MPIPRFDEFGNYDLAASDYFKHHDQAQKEAWHRTRLVQAERLLKSRGRLLDVGSGRGELLRVAKEAGWQVTGIEPSPRFAEYAAAYSGADVKQSRLEQCAFADASFDAVILAGVIEHVYKPVRMVQEISRILRSGGALFVDVPNEAGLFFRMGNLYQRLCGRNWVVNLSPTFPPFHIFGFTPPSLRIILARYGLSPVVWRTYGGSSRVPRGGGFTGMIERGASVAITRLSNWGDWGTYIETWALKH
jgi:SAM-dependent methyltransferase